MKQEIGITAKPKSAATIADERLGTGVVNVSAKIDPTVQQAMQNGVVDINKLREIQGSTKSEKKEKETSLEIK